MTEIAMMSVGDHELSVAEDGTGPAVMLLHGIGGTSAVYRGQAAALAAAGARVIRPDFAGAGRSPLGRSRITVDSHAADAIEILAGLDVDRVLLVGHSMGGLVARAIAATRPDLVSGLVLLGAVSPPTPPAAQAIRNRAGRIREMGSAVVADEILDVSVSAETRRLRPEITAFIRQLICGQDPAGYAANNEALAEATDPGEVSTDLPMTLVAGEQDTLSPPELSVRIAAGHENRKVVVIPGIGHWIPLEASSQVAALLISSLDGT
ncbi:alpha/beta hydrolase [Catenulispora sp. NF23]|uniref:Alpha/beta hydrolase n=1 Tax=Catenulispora pinistramenti TaxID=2705254 RepID=A0ABS5KIZ8_9ACTN|nr:alpha/beta hydrolase [Catenulispora pinistramenti]MBS2533620.1 alpha/beta hydrolase [Catenulispora pinistramenti]MBS2545870.1 alpha/beta hydrolase [Catenulispora pinistramenti]